jgi:hypothetical protein
LSSMRSAYHIVPAFPAIALACVSGVYMWDIIGGKS